MAPNLITLIAFVIVLISHCVFMFWGEDQFGKPLPPWKCVLMCVTIFLYQHLDNMDGKQARRTSKLLFRVRKLHSCWNAIWPWGWCYYRCFVWISVDCCIGYPISWSEYIFYLLLCALSELCWSLESVQHRTFQIGQNQPHRRRSSSLFPFCIIWCILQLLLILQQSTPIRKMERINRSGNWFSNYFHCSKNAQRPHHKPINTKQRWHHDEIIASYHLTHYCMHMEICYKQKLLHRPLLSSRLYSDVHVGKKYDGDASLLCDQATIPFI